ncbi:FAD-dependent oxidoreductase [Cryobacterium melibiosiphilum]|uniref:FAD-dependent oxidoreductase n=1 Tax=Cryobacterium melibiosiphilum TaxID=995039 RepID=A0A3A5MTR3_9MICO|nr:FAD-dependent oxidoreductase [Cryobacterium melibiosiphilum]RJT88614.1 FAD-dependent oxidoreductase [Cryobacterium melibiosiphilum]
MSATTNASKYVVIGAGLAGAATAWQLASRGHEVTIVERSHPANDAGSSHGSARIFRYAYPDEFYTGLVQQSKIGWDELARLGGTPLITPTGSVDYGADRNPAQLATILEARGIEHELLSAAEARSRWPQIAFDTPVLWHPGAGVIDAETAVTTMVRLAVEHGARLLNDWPVAAVQSTTGGYRVVSTTGATLDAENVIVSAGGWLPQLLENLALPAGFLAQIPAFEVRQEQAYHFPYRDQPAAPGSTPAWPTFIHKMPGMQVYGLPGGRDAGFHGQKVAEYNGGKRLSSAADQDGLMDPSNRARVVDYVSRYLPGVVPEPYAETTCLFTNTPTEDFILDRVDGITVLSPCSGHGAKFAPEIGRLAADLATGIGEVPAQFRVAGLAAAGRAE